jgi:hypothetical protein
MKLNKTITLITLAFSLNCYSLSDVINTQGLALNRADEKLNDMTFDSFLQSEFILSQEVGKPALPTKSYLFAAEPQDIQLDMQLVNPRQITNVKIIPSLPEKCRCTDELTEQQKQFSFSKALYQEKQISVMKTYLGKYKGTPLTKVDVKLVSYDAAHGVLTTYDQVKVTSTAELFNFNTSRTANKNFLIVAPQGWENSVAEFIAHKTSLGFKMVTEFVSTPENTKESIQNKIKKYYTDQSVAFVMIVGDERTIPMFALNTSASSQTPSDLPYFLMDGASDHVPDIMASRIVAATAAAAQEQLAKIVKQENLNSTLPSDSKNIIGIASNEGSNPSDADYITAINNSLSDKWRSNVSYFYQNNQNSTAQNLNAAINSGAYWLTYVGHGSGYAWPSMYGYYSTEDINGINNSELAKPVVIDVACQNGRLLADHLGSQFMNPTVQKANNGAAAYFGGSVNISWHPPALMARGIALEHMANNYNYLGEALFAGQLYLSKNWSNAEDVIDNVEWYHLQGDPSFSIHY